MNFENDEIKHVITNNIDYLQFKRLLKYPEINHAYVLKTHDMTFRLGTNFRHIGNVKKNLKIVAEILRI